jgi:cytosine/adenosine deaminase-related metal-dependent hydrolase
LGDILIKDGFIANMDAGRTVYSEGSLYIDDGRIVSVVRSVEAPRSPENVVDARHKVVARERYISLLSSYLLDSARGLAQHED